MDRSVELVALNCVRCSRPLPAAPAEVAWVCAQCGQGQRLDDVQGLVALEVNYAVGERHGQRQGQLGRPCWVLEVQVRVQRQTYRGDESQAAGQFWSQPRQFMIPAYDCSIDALLSEGLRMLGQPPELQAGPPGPFLPVTLALEDVTAAAEFIVLAVEAARRDQLRQVQFSLEAGPPSLWVLPG